MVRTLILGLWMLLVGVAMPARAQEAPAEVAGEVAIELERFGTGGARAGGWAGVRLRLFDTADRSRTVLVRLEGWDSDGDVPLYQRAVTLNPGVWQGVWMYARLPTGFGPSTPMSVLVHAAEEREGALAPGEPPYRAGRLLGSAVLAAPAPRVVAPGHIVYGVVGPNAVGLQRYETRIGSGDISPYAHEPTTVFAGLTPEDFPDSWLALAMYDALVWVAGDPAALGGERARAVREWVRRGGHLVVVLPPAGQEWTRSVNNELASILPSVTVRRVPAASLEPFRYLLTTDPDLGLPAGAVVHELTPMEGVPPSEAAVLLAGEDGTGVVAQRLVGLGAVTMVGLPLALPSLTQAALPEASVFWNRVLGRRGEFVSATELAVRQTEPSLAPAERVRVVYDADLASRIAQTGRAAVGVLLGFGVFVLYWLVAGPVGYAVLRATGRARHAWLAFVASAAVFTALAWGGATLLRPKQVEANHVSFIDHVYGQPVQRVRSWQSVLIPWYGEAAIAVGVPAEAGAESRDPAGVLAPWDGGDAGGGGGFPDVRGYPIATRAPDVLRVPVRSTVKRFVADWSGGPVWAMPRPVTGDDGPTRLALRDRGVWRSESVLEGVLVHDLPAALEDVLIVANPGMRSLGRPLSGSLISDARAFKVARWEPGQPLDLAAVTRDEGVGSLLQSYLADLTPTPRANVAVLTDLSGSIAPATRLAALSFFGALQPPESGSNATQLSPAAVRTQTHGLDLSRWLTRPSVVVVARIEGQGASPVPLFVDGRDGPVRSRGLTVVRWVYPLEPAPPGVRPASMGGGVE